MSTFKVWYVDEDANVISGNLNRSDLTQTEKTLAQKIWNGGMKNWASAPFGLSPCDDPNSPVTSHEVTITASNVTLADFSTLLNSIGTRLGTAAGGYLTSLAADVAQCGQQL